MGHYSFAVTWDILALQYKVWPKFIDNKYSFL